MSGRDEAGVTLQAGKALNVMWLQEKNATVIKIFSWGRTLP